MPIKRYTKEEMRRMAEVLYEKVIRGHVDEGNDGRIVAIDVDSGDYELDDESYPAVKRMLARRPEAQIYSFRIGYPAVVHFGGSFAPRQS